MIDNRLFDLEEELRLIITEQGFDNVSCPAPTGDLKPGSVLIEQTGGMTKTLVSDEYTYQVEVWHETPEQALSLANAIATALTGRYSEHWYGLPKLLSIPHFSTTSRSGGRIKSTSAQKSSRLSCYLFNIVFHIRRKD